MDDWTKELEQWLEPIAREVAAVVEEATEQVDRWVEQSIQEIDQSIQELDRTATEWQQQIQQQAETHLTEVWGIEVDRLRQEFDASIAPWLAEWWDWLAPFDDQHWPDYPPNQPPNQPPDRPGDASSPTVPNQYDAIYEQLNPKVLPTPDRHAACIGCQHYHGRLHSGTLLICGMHPFGWETASCPDWEGEGPASKTDPDLTDRP
ncbi:MAG: hypothetical protein EA001_16655 [Oscillatoriales cyanobacterium]|nr:MAG: hypothetical protein EA001_16655 [Oscillatoriales cyanobacterium]